MEILDYNGLKILKDNITNNFLQKGSNITIGTINENNKGYKTTITNSDIELLHCTQNDGDEYIQISPGGILASPSGSIGTVNIEGFNMISAESFKEDNEFLYKRYLSLSGGTITGDLTINGTITGNGSGLTNVNAVTLSGKDLSYFEPHKSYAPIYEGNILDISEMGVYSCYDESCTNLPPSGTENPIWWYVWVTRFRDSGYKLFYATPLNFRDNNSNIYYASEYGGASTLTWGKINDDGNAAMLEGHSASYFQTAMFQTIDDLLNANAKTIYLCNDAKNAPHKYGLTTAGVGICICSYCNSSYITLAYIPSGVSDMFIANINSSSTSITWRKINDGGNAKTLDGNSISDIQTRASGYASYTDWNDITTPGYYGLMKTSTTNAPNTTQFYYPFVFKYSDEGLTQLAIPYRYSSSNGTTKIYIRNLMAGTWSSWSVVGEGCNADTLDGYHASNLLNASNISSGTLSVARGGTGLNSLTSGYALIGNGTNAISLKAIDTTSGGTSGSSNLITSGAVYNISNLFNYYDSYNITHGLNSEFRMGFDQNINYYYIKFNNGLLIMSINRLIPTSSTATTVTLPISFINNKYIILGGDFSTGNVGKGCVFIEQQYPGYFTYYGTRVDNNYYEESDDFNSFILMGRWK